MMSRSIVVSGLLSAVVGLMLAAPSQAALIVYEPFAGYTAGSLIGQNPNANSLGLATDTAYSLYNSAAATSTGLLTTGLTMEAGGKTLTTSGDALAIDVTTSANVNAFLAGKLSLTSPVSSGATIWQSYLAQITERGGVTNSGGGTRITDQASGAMTNQHFLVEHDSPNIHGPAARYLTTATTATTDLLDDTTYLIIAKHTNVGASGSGTTKLWALTPTQFATFTELDNYNEAWLDAGTNVAAKASSTGTGTGANNAFASGKFLHMVVSQNGLVGGPKSAGSLFDELRFGDSLADVTPHIVADPVPEPASLALLSLGLLGLVAYRGKRSLK